MSGPVRPAPGCGKFSCSSRSETRDISAPQRGKERADSRSWQRGHFETLAPVGLLDISSNRTGSITNYLGSCGEF